MNSSDLEHLSLIYSDYLQTVNILIALRNNYSLKYLYLSDKEGDEVKGVIQKFWVDHLFSEKTQLTTTEKYISDIEGFLDEFRHMRIGLTIETDFKEIRTKYDVRKYFKRQRCNY